MSEISEAAKGAAKQIAKKILSISEIPCAFCERWCNYEYECCPHIVEIIQQAIDTATAELIGRLGSEANDEIERLRKCYATIREQYGIDGDRIPCGESDLMRIECKKMTSLRGQVEGLGEENKLLRARVYELEKGGA